MDGGRSNVDTGGISKGTIAAALVLVLIVVGVVWYFNSAGSDPEAGGTIPQIETDDPGVATSIVP